jgi:multiple sugar transport system permease protein
MKKKSRPLRNKYGKMKLKKMFIDFGLTASLPIIFSFSLFVLYPLINSLVLSVTNFEIIAELFQSTKYWEAFRNLLIFLSIAVPIKFLIALLISGFLITYKNSILGKIIGAIYLLPWALPTVASALAFRWSLDFDFGLFNKILTDLGLPRIPFLLSYWPAMLSIILFHVWKWAPMWTLLLYAGRQSIPEELYESAQMDGASVYQRFFYITMPLIKKLFLICLLLSLIWSTGEFEAIWLVTMAGPAGATHTITTLGFQQVFQYANLMKGLSIYISVLPIACMMMLILIVLFRRRSP